MIEGSLFSASEALRLDRDTTDKGERVAKQLGFDRKLIRVPGGEWKGLRGAMNRLSYYGHRKGDLARFPR
jgi:hypothetical protein